MLLALAPLHAHATDMSALWTEKPEFDEDERVFAAILKGVGWGSDDSSPTVSARAI